MLSSRSPLLTQTRTCAPVHLHTTTPVTLQTLLHTHTVALSGGRTLGVDGAHTLLPGHYLPLTVNGQHFKLPLLPG